MPSMFFSGRRRVDIKNNIQDLTQSKRLARIMMIVQAKSA